MARNSSARIGGARVARVVRGGMTMAKLAATWLLVGLAGSALFGCGSNSALPNGKESTSGGSSGPSAGGTLGQAGNTGSLAVGGASAHTSGSYGGQVGPFSGGAIGYGGGFTGAVGGGSEPPPPVGGAAGQWGGCPGVGGLSGPSLGGGSGTNRCGTGGDTGMGNGMKMDKVAKIGVGGYHACALLTDGTVDCWGDNVLGQRGEAPWINVNFFVPTPVANLAEVIDVNAGYVDSCAMFAGGRLSCWGSNRYGQLGNGTVTDWYDPTPVQGLAAKQIALGSYSSCAVLTDNTVSCWGLNDDGQLGDGTTTDRLAPTPVPGISNVVQVGAGISFNCALLADGTVDCWGNNSGSDLCADLNVFHASATPVAGLSGVTQISVGEGHACALLADGTVSCWGSNDVGQLGRDAVCASGTSNEKLAGPPGVIPGLTGVVQVAAGEFHTCARLQGGTVSCWGWNNAGQLGDGTTTDHTSPTLVPGLSGVVQLSLGGSSTCALLDDHTVSCWGQIGRPPHVTPTPVTY